MAKLLKLTMLAALGFGLWQWGQAATVQAKAWLAPILIQRAWTESQVHDVDVRPWPWADTWPVARLQAPNLDVDLYILEGASGRVLAFGPGHLESSASPGTQGHSIVGGHRDTHFAFLRELSAGMPLRIQDMEGRWRDYRVQGSDIIDSRQARLAPSDDRALLTLVTCYPFDTVVPGGPLRYLVIAEASDALVVR